MVSILDGLCSDLRLIVYRLLYDSYYTQVKKEYATKFGCYWRASVQSFDSGWITIMDRNLCNHPHHRYSGGLIYDFTSGFSTGNTPSRCVTLRFLFLFYQTLGMNIPWNEINKWMVWHYYTMTSS